MTLFLTPFLRGLRLELAHAVKNRVTLTVASMASSMFIASLFSGLIMQLFFKSSVVQRVLIRLFMFPLLIEAMLLAVRAVARAAFGPGVAAQNTLFFLLPPMLTASLVGRFLSTNLETLQETVAVSMAVATVEMVLRFTLPLRDAAAQRVRRVLCCAPPLHEAGTAQGRMSAAWEQRRWSHFHFAFMELDSMCEDVGVLLALPITLLFAMPPAPGAAPLGAGAVLLRVLVQLLIESGTDLSAAWGAVCVRWACGLSLRPVRVSRLVNDHLQLPRLQNSVVVIDETGVLSLTPSAKPMAGGDVLGKAEAHMGIPAARDTGQRSVEPPSAQPKPASPHGPAPAFLSHGTPSHSLELRSPRPEEAHLLANVCNARSPPTAENPPAPQGEPLSSLQGAEVEVVASLSGGSVALARGVPPVSLLPARRDAPVTVQLTPIETPGPQTAPRKAAAVRTGVLDLVRESFVQEWHRFAVGPSAPELPTSRCCGRICQACRLTHGCAATSGDIQARTAAGALLQELFLAEAQAERASLWQNLPLSTVAASALVGQAQKRPGVPVQGHTIDDSGSAAAGDGAAVSSPLRSLPLLKRVALLLALRLEGIAVKRMYAWELLPPGLRMYFVLAVLAAAVSVVHHSFNTQLRCAYTLPDGGYKFDFCTGL